MHTIPAPASTSNSATFADDMLRLEQDIMASQMRRESEQIREMHRLQREDDCRCRRCGDLTEGITICGQRLQACPACFAGFVAKWEAPTLASV